MASTGRSRGPASRPPRRPSATRPATRSGSGKGSGSASGTSGRGGGRTASTSASASADTPARTTSDRGPTTGALTAAKVVRRPGPAWRGRLGGAVTHRFARRGVVLLSIAVFLAVILGSTVAAWFHQRSQIAALRERVATQEQDVADLRAEQERWSDPVYVEQQARKRLKFVRPGERSYTVLDPRPDSGDELADTDIAQPRANLPWYEMVRESARTADAPGARR